MKKRADGRYSAQVYLGKDENDKRKVKTIYGKTQKEVKQKIAEEKARLGKGLVIDDKSTFAEWGKLYLSTLKISESEKNILKSRIKYFSDILDDIPMLKILPYSIEKSLYDLAEYNPYTKKKTAKRTLERYFSACSQVFYFARKNRAIEFNPCDDVELSKCTQEAPKNERRELTDDEIKWIINCNHRAKLPAMLSMFAGLRRGEMTALTWQDIDLKNKTITVDKSFDFKSGKIKDPKTDDGFRIVPIPDILVDYLSTVKKKNTLVVTSAHGTRMSESAWKRLLESLQIDITIALHPDRKKSKFEPTQLDKDDSFTWHCLRHTYATLLYDAGVDVLTMQRCLGHADSKTTIDIYTHLTKRRKAKSITNFNSFIDTEKNIFKSNSSQTD